jgi:hypothetical protein
VADSPWKYHHLVAIDIEVQRLQLGDVVMIDLPGQPAKVEGKVVREVERMENTVLVTLRVAGRDDFARRWMLDEMVTVVRGP